ncbi:hypothetical protein, partial [Dysgonomonas sp. 25]|uniref:hypothetical protein n=1 Tax=Dysgonomonas sp. 25 TaxID=2302933 RepID=UPI0013D5A1EA
GRVIQKGGVFHVELPGTGNWDFMVVDQSGSTFINWYEAIDRNKKIIVRGWGSKFKEMPYIEPGSTWVKVTHGYWKIHEIYTVKLNKFDFPIHETGITWTLTKETQKSGAWLRLSGPGAWKFTFQYQETSWDETYKTHDETLYLRRGYNLW